VFILYYGLERHLLSGDFERSFGVILKLRDVHANRSFQRYSANALILSSILHKKGEFVLEFINSLDKEHEFNFLDNLFLMCYYSFDIPILPKDIMRIIAHLNGQIPIISKNILIFSKKILKMPY
jgi:hypothetical protein